jgi:hypothetical protein
MTNYLTFSIVILTMSEFNLERVLGAFPSPWDDRHYRVPLATMENIEKLPEEFSLLDWVKRPLDSQGNIGSCVGHCGDEVYSDLYYKLYGEYINFSAGWLYARSRHYANIPPHMQGSTNLGLMKALHKEGVTTEECATTDTVYPFTIEPCEDAYEIASAYMIESYHYVNKTPADMRAAMYGLIKGFPEKTPLVAAFPVYESFKDSYDDGVVPMPEKGEKLLGGHSSPLFGYRKDKSWENPGSWGSSIGDKGVFYLPENYPFYDVWLIKLKVGEPPNPEPKKSLICQLLEALQGYFGCEGGE